MTVNIVPLNGSMFMHFAHPNFLCSWILKNDALKFTGFILVREVVPIFPKFQFFQSNSQKPV